MNSLEDEINKAIDWHLTNSGWHRYTEDPIRHYINGQAQPRNDYVPYYYKLHEHPSGIVPFWDKLDIKTSGDFYVEYGGLRYGWAVGYELSGDLFPFHHFDIIQSIPGTGWGMGVLKIKP